MNLELGSREESSFTSLAWVYTVFFVQVFSAKSENGIEIMEKTHFKR